MNEALFILYIYDFKINLWKTPVELTRNEKIISLFKECDKTKSISLHSLPKFSIEYSGDPFSGIFNELTKKCHNNICDEGIINISGNECRGSPSISTIVDYNFNDICYNSSNEKNSFICFDFKNNSISVSAYSIKSSNHPSPDFLQTWVLEGSNNKKNWVVLDSHTNDRSLNSIKKVGVFHIKESDKRSQKFKFIQLRMTGESIQGNYYLDILNIELFGIYN